jgi:hypothetical protein
MSMLGCSLRVSVTQLLMNFRLASQLIFWPFAFAFALHATVASFRATLSGLDVFAASAGVGMNVVPLTSTVATIPANKAGAKYNVLSLDTSLAEMLLRTAMTNASLT